MKTKHASAYFALFGVAKEIACTKVSPLRVCSMRCELNKHIVKEILRCKAEITRHEMHRYDLHHQIPLSLGGGNDMDNLVLIDKTLHTIVHLFIGHQNEMKIGETKQLLVPFKPAGHAPFTFASLSSYWIP